MFKTLFVIASLVCLILFSGNTCTSMQKTIVDGANSISDTSLKQNTLSYLPLLEDTVTEITINLVGDLMCHKPQTNNAEISPGVYNFKPSFEYIKPYLQDADLTVGNLETTFAGTSQPYAGYPAFNSPDAYCEALKDAGFDFLVTANNHSMDTRESGLLRTIDVIKKNGLGYTGTYLNQRDRDSVRILDIKGIRLAILNYTYGTNGSYPEKEHNYMLNVIDSALIDKDVKTAKQKGADIVMVFYHMGIENKADPVPSQLDAVRYAITAGAGLVIGAHPHVIGPTQMIYSNIIKDSVFVAYSLGNFISNQYWRYTDAGVVLKLTLRKKHATQATSFNKASYLPTWVYRGDGTHKMHIIFPAQLASDSLSLPAFINKQHRLKMLEAFDDTKTVLTKQNPAIQLNSVK